MLLFRKFCLRTKYNIPSDTGGKFLNKVPIDPYFFSGSPIGKLLFKVKNKDTRKSSSQPAFTCSKSTMETLEHYVKSAQSLQ